MTTDLSTKYDLKVPRYTSYPTAPHFHDGVDGTTYGDWLSALDPATGLSLYFHIPFCDSMCWFCGCYTKIVKQYKPVSDYLDVVLKEIDLVAAHLPGRFTAHHLHWGGGSPTMLTGDDWMRILDRIRARFDIAPTAEVAVELDPRTATEDYVKALSAAGVNRASIGVQDFHPEVQAAINRIQPYDMTAQVVGWLRAHGIDHVNMDLLYGLPHQTTERVIDMVDQAVSLKPARVALFGYAHVPWMKSHQKLINEADLPGVRARFDQFAAASARLVDHGYLRVGLDHYALPDDGLADALAKGVLHRNFQGYTADTAPVMLGFGASSIGQVPQGYIQNLSPLKTYREHVEAGKLPIARGFALRPEDVLRGAVIERVMCDLAVDLAAIAEAHGAAPDTFTAELEALKPLAEDGIVTLDGPRVTVTETGRPFVRLVAATFDTYLASGQGRHSQAV
ncbi:MAG: oxygen-independent coproporphyrinogen III oxidase [Rhodobacterales bacterium]|nr:oxygen-independent coproporphyrinogen III oxidase [Rhodobacterales bacterium]